MMGFSGIGNQSLYGYGQYIRDQKSASGNKEIEGKAAEKAKASEAAENKTEKERIQDAYAELAEKLKTGLSRPTPVKETKEYGKTVGDVELSDKAAKYYGELKKKYPGMDFVLVSEDEKDKVRANAALYASPGKTAVLINQDKIERMASDPAYAEKQESILKNAGSELEKMKEQILNSGVQVEGFGIQVNDDGSTSFFAAVKKSSDGMKAIMEKKQAAKQAAKKAEAKKTEKKKEALKAEKKKEAKKAEKEKAEKQLKETEEEGSGDSISEKTDSGRAVGAFYRKFRETAMVSADSAEELLDKLKAFASAPDSMDTGTTVGSLMDFRG